MNIYKIYSEHLRFDSIKLIPDHIFEFPESIQKDIFTLNQSLKNKFPKKNDLSLKACFRILAQVQTYFHSFTFQKGHKIYLWSVAKKITKWLKTFLGWILFSNLGKATKLYWMNTSKIIFLRFLPLVVFYDRHREAMATPWLDLGSMHLCPTLTRQFLFWTMLLDCP